MLDWQVCACNSVENSDTLEKKQCHAKTKSIIC